MFFPVYSGEECATLAFVGNFMKNSSGVFYEATLSYAQSALSFEDIVRIIIQIREDLFSDGYAV